MKASDAVATLLAHKNVSVGFELIGGMITHLVDSINQLGKTQLISVHHEQGASFAAGGVARATDNQVMGLALGTSGPGATNLITGLSDCWLDNVPCLFFTGQVNSYESKGDRLIKQQGFQELDIVNVVKSITKYAKQITCVEELLPEINKAIDIARSGRPGPVLLDIPMNFQRETVDVAQLDALLSHCGIKNAVQPTNTAQNAEVINVREALIKANKPLVLLGGGAVNDALLPLFIETLQALQIPYVASLKGCEKVTASPLYFGMIGSYGTRVANFAIQHCDLLLVLGSRLDVRQTGSDCNDFARHARIIQIDIDEHQLNNRVKAHHSVVMDIQGFYEQFIQIPVESKNTSSWVNALAAIQSASFINEYQEFSLNPFDIFCMVNKTFANVDVQFVCDVGNNQMWAAHTLRLSTGQKAHHSGGLGAMGFAIPTALGVQLGSGKPVVCFTGDGGAHLNIQELDIIAREHLPILVIVLNNKALGMVKNFQDMYFDGRNQSTSWGRYSCDFVLIAQGYNMQAKKVGNLSELASVMESFRNNPQPLLVEVDIESVNECRPRLSFGDKLDSQSPKMTLPVGE